MCKHTCTNLNRSITEHSILLDNKNKLVNNESIKINNNRELSESVCETLVDIVSEYNNITYIKKLNFYD